MDHRITFGVFLGHYGTRYIKIKQRWNMVECDGIRRSKTMKRHHMFDDDCECLIMFELVIAGLNYFELKILTYNNLNSLIFT